MPATFRRSIHAANHRVSQEYHENITLGRVRIHATCRATRDARFRDVHKKKKESSAAPIERRGSRLAADSQLRRERTCRAQNPTERRRRAADALAVGKLWAEFCRRDADARRPGVYAPVRSSACVCLAVPVAVTSSLSLSRALASPRHRREAPDGAAAGRFPGARFARGASLPDFSNGLSSSLFSLSSFIPTCVTRAPLAIELSRVSSPRVIPDEFFSCGLHAATRLDAMRLDASNRSLR